MGELLRLISSGDISIDKVSDNVRRTYNLRHELFARLCDETGKGMNCGYLIGDCSYLSEGNDDILDKDCKDAGYASTFEAFDDGFYCFTEWSCEDEYQSDPETVFYTAAGRGVTMNADGSFSPLLTVEEELAKVNQEPVKTYLDVIKILSHYGIIVDTCEPDSDDDTILNHFLERAKTMETFLPYGYKEASFGDLLDTVKIYAKGVEELTIAKAREFLSDRGYYADNLWHVDDVLSHDHAETLDDVDAMEILNSAVNSDYVKEIINNIIQDEVKGD